MVELAIKESDHGFEWTMIIDLVTVLKGTSPAEHICMLDAREAMKRFRDSDSESGELPAYYW